VLPCISKLFTKVSHKRLVKWVIDNDKMHDTQAGFTKNKSTVDHIFVLQTLVT
jgi:hypothetical protein